MTFEDLIDDKSRDKLYGIIRAREQAEHDEWLRKQEAEKKFVEATHFKTAQEMIDWVMAGESMYSEYGDEMKLSDDRTKVGHYGQHGNGFDDCTFWYGWTWQPVDEWKKWVHRIDNPEYYEFGYLPCWGKMQKWKYKELHNITE